MATRMSRAESKQATRADLLDAARRVFVERGYHGASLDLVAREAGYTKGAVYSAFGSKGRMFLAVYDREVGARWDRIEAETIDAEGPEFAVASARDWVARVRTERAWTITLLEFRLHAARDPELNAAYAEGHRRVMERLAGVLTRTGVPADRALHVALDLMAMFNGLTLEQLAVPDEVDEERYARNSAALIEALTTPPRR